MLIERFSPIFFTYLVMTVMYILLIAIIWNDAKQYRIPNKLVYSGIVFGLLFNSLLPDGNGFVSNLPGALGFWKAMSGFGIALLVLLPLYALRGMGAGDVKLMAMIGSFLGPKAICLVILLTFIVGGVISIYLTFKRKKGEVLIQNIKTLGKITMCKILFLKEVPVLDAMPNSVGRFPYAVAISGGTIAYSMLIFQTNFLDLFNL